LANEETLEAGDLTEIGKDGITDPSSPVTLSNGVLNASNDGITVTLNGESIEVKQATAKIIQSLRNKRREFVNGLAHNEGKSS